LALSLRQLTESFSEHRSTQGRILREIDLHSFGMRHPDHSPPPSSHLVVALASDDAQEPGLKGAADSQAAQLAPSPYGGFLHRILGKAWIVQEPPRVLVGGGNGRAEDGLKSLDVAPSSPGDELLLRSDLHNLTLNTGEEDESVSASAKVHRQREGRSDLSWVERLGVSCHWRAPRKAAADRKRRGGDDVGVIHLRQAPI
jgi:hypothetical protein